MKQRFRHFQFKKNLANIVPLYFVHAHFPFIFYSPWDIVTISSKYLFRRMKFQHYKIKINAFSTNISCVCLSSSITILFCVSVQPPFCYSLDTLHSPTEEGKEKSLKILNRSLFFFQELSTETSFYFKLLVNAISLIQYP